MDVTCKSCDMRWSHTLQGSLVDALENRGDPKECEGKVEVQVGDLWCVRELAILGDQFCLRGNAQSMEVLTKET